jgi:hypothetical protein
MRVFLFFLRLMFTKLGDVLILGIFCRPHVHRLPLGLLGYALWVFGLINLGQ